MKNYIAYFQKGTPKNGVPFRYTSNKGHLSNKTTEYIKSLSGQIRYAQNHPETNQFGVNPEFWKRLKEPTIRTINLNGTPASHRMSYGEIDGKYIIYPEIQEVNGKLVYNPDILSAYKSNNFIIAPSEEIAKNFSEHYKEADAFPGFRKFNPVSNLSYYNAIQDNFPKIQVAYKKFSDAGYNPEQIAGILGNLIVESKLNENQQESNKGKGYGIAQWTTDGRKAALKEHQVPYYYSEFERQLDFLLKEMQDPKIWTRCKNEFESQKDSVPFASNATHYFMSGFENPKKSASHEKDRQEVANYLQSPEFQAKLKSNLIDYTSSITNPSQPMWNTLLKPNSLKQTK